MAEMWKMMAQAQYFKWDRVNLKTGKTESTLIQAGLRPSILGTWEYTFPEEALPEVLSMMGLQTGDVFNIGAKRTFYNLGALNFLRIILRLKRVPKAARDKAQKVPPTLSINGSWRGLSSLMVMGVTIHPIGIKYDVREKKEEWGYEQEML